MHTVKLTTLLLLSAAAAAANAQERDMTLEQERDRMGAQMEENRQQIDRDINRIREPATTQDPVPTLNRGGVQSDAYNPRPAVPGNAGSGAGTGLPSAQDNERRSTGGTGNAPVQGTTGAPVTPSGANGNANPGAVTPPGGIGTGNGNGTGGAATGGAASGNPTGGAAGQR